MSFADLNLLCQFAETLQSLSLLDQTAVFDICNIKTPYVQTRFMPNANIPSKLSKVIHIDSSRLYEKRQYGQIRQHRSNSCVV